MANLKRGDLVWARVMLPNKWWPGVLLRTDSLGCFVSFFHLQNSRYFHPAEICSFQQHFKLHISTCSCPTTNILLERAFKLLGQRILKCPTTHTILFQPQQLLSFVRSVAVSPCVEDADFLTAVYVLAQITAFRHHYLYSSGHSRTKADPCSIDMMHTAAEDIEANCQVEDHIFSEQLEKNCPASLIDRKKISNLFPAANHQLDIISTIQTKYCETQSHLETLLERQVSALNQFYLDGNTLNWSVLSLRNLSHKTTFDICFKNCCPLEKREPQAYNTGYIEFLVGAKVHDETGMRKIILPFITHMEYPGKCLGLKRQLDQSVDSEPALKLRKTLLFSINEADSNLWRSRRERNAVLSDTSLSLDNFCGPSELCNTMALSSNVADACPQRNITRCIADLLLGSPSKLKTPNLSHIAAQSSPHICSHSLMDLVWNMLNFLLPEHRLPKVMKLDEIDCSQDNSGTLISCANKQQPEQREATCTSDAYVDTKEMFQSSDFRLVANSKAGSCTDDNEADDVGSGTRNEYEMLPVNGDNSSSIEISGRRSMDVENRKLVQPVGSASKSQQAQQSEAQTNLSFSKSLFIKFPANYSLPSKEELVKKFSPFGIVDSFSTKVYFYTGTAQVVFLDQLDAMAAYQFAKRNKLFGEENIRFWLDPTEHKRGPKFPVRFSLVTSKVPEFDLKSCLKKSKSLTKENKRCPRKVRFIMET